MHIITNKLTEATISNSTNHVRNTHINPECFNRIVYQQQPICERHKCDPKMHKKPQKKIMEIEISKFTKLENFDKSGIYRIYVRMRKKIQISH